MSVSVSVSVSVVLTVKGSKVDVKIRVICCLPKSVGRESHEGEWDWHYGEYLVFYYYSSLLVYRSV